MNYHYGSLISLTREIYPFPPFNLPFPYSAALKQTRSHCGLFFRHLTSWMKGTELQRIHDPQSTPACLLPPHAPHISLKFAPRISSTSFEASRTRGYAGGVEAASSVPRMGWRVMNLRSENAGKASFRSTLFLSGVVIG